MTPRARGPGGLLACAFAAGLASVAVSAANGCSTRSPAVEALRPYATATLAAGAGFPDVGLRATTLAPFLERFPGGLLTVVAGDRMGVDIIFPDERLGFLFEFEGECAEALAPTASRLLPQLRDPSTFFERHPACAATPLRSVSAWAGKGPEDTFFEGATELGVALFARRARVSERYGPAEDVRGRWVSSSSPEDDGFEELAYRRGIVFSIGEAVEGPDAGHLVVKKIAVFPPVD